MPSLPSRSPPRRPPWWTRATDYAPRLTEIQKVKLMRATETEEARSLAYPFERALETDEARDLV